MYFLRLQARLVTGSRTGHRLAATRTGVDPQWAIDKLNRCLGAKAAT